MKRFKKGILLTLATMVLGGAIIGVGSEMANSSRQLERIHRAVSSEVLTSSETTSTSSSSESTSGTEVQDVKRVQVGDELAGKTIWFNPYLLLKKVDYSSIYNDSIELINFDITGTLGVHSTPPNNEGGLSESTSFKTDDYRGYLPISLPYYWCGQGGNKSYYHAIGYFDERLSDSSPSNDYQSDFPKENNYNDWYSITFYNSETFKMAEDEHGGYVGVKDLSIKVKSFGSTIDSLFFYEKPKSIIQYKNTIKTIYKQKNAVLTIDDIIKKLEIKGYKSLKVVKDDYSGNGNKPGSYEIVLEYTDDVVIGDISVNIVVPKGDLPTAVWNFEYLNNTFSENYNLTIDTNERLKITKDDLISIVSYCTNVNNEIVSFEFNGDTEAIRLLNDEGIDKEGNYKVVVGYSTSNSGHKYEFNTTINVASKDSGTIVDKRLNVWQKTCKFFSDVCNNIKNFFVWLYDHTIGAIVKFFQKKD